jgi:hypothetical protein
MNDAPRRVPWSRVAAYGIAIALLCVPALWNGFPLMFDDVGGYLERWPTGTLGHGRSTVYGLLLWITRSSAFVPVLLLQAFVTAFVVDRAFKIFAPKTFAPKTFALKASSWLLIGAIAAISATSGVALSVSKVIPDAWAAPAVLALHLLAWHREGLSPLERAGLMAIVIFAGASHMATFGVLAGLSGLYATAWLARARLGTAPTGIVSACAAVCCGLVLLLGVNAIVAGRFALTPGGQVFLLGRMMEDGLAAEILKEECPRSDWQLCAYRNALPDYAEAFIFDASSPLQKIGGEDDPRVQREVNAIIARSLIRHPLEHLKVAAVLTAQQFLDAGTGSAFEPLMGQHARWTLSRFAPALVPSFDHARQQTASIDLDPWSDWVVIPIAVVASLALPGLAVLLWRAGCRREAVLPAMVFLALLGNAAICGVMVGSNDRYQARLAWLAPFALALAVPALRRREIDRGLGAEPAGLVQRLTAGRPVVAGAPDRSGSV